MKKSDGGYVLVYVLIVIVVVALLALTLCAISLRNFQSQQSAVLDMQEQYAAEGIMEQFEAGVQALHLNGDGQEGSAKTAFKNEVDALCAEIPAELSDTQWSGDCCTFTVHVASDEASVTAKMEIRLSIEITSVEIPAEDGGEPEIRYSYKLSVKDIHYLSYDIGTSDGGGEEEAA